MVIVLAVLGLLLLAGAGVLGFFAVRNFRQASLLGTPVTRAADLQPGLCKVQGRLVAVGNPLRSPVTDRPCVYHRLRVAQEHRQWVTTARPAAASPAVVTGGILGGALGGLIVGMITSGAQDEGTTKIHQSWVPVLDDAQSTRLVVEDASGQVGIELRGAEVIPKKPYHIYTDLHRPAPQELADFLQKKYRLFMVDEDGRVLTMKVEEDRLKEGAKVTVLGNVAERADGTLCFRAKAGPLLVSERDLDKVHRSARNRALGYAAGAGGCLLVAAVLLIVALAAG